MCFIDPFQGTVMAKFAAENLKVKRVVILKDIKNEYSVGLTEFFTAAFTQRGGQIIGEQAYSSGDTDFRAQLTAIKAKHPEAIYLPGYYTEAGLIIRQARELGITVPVLGGDGWESDKLIGIGGEALEGCFYSNHFAADNPDPRLQEFLKAYRAKHDGQDPNAIVGLAYDAANVLFASMQKLFEQDPAAFKGLSSTKAGTPERKDADRKLRDIIAGTANFVGVTGTITLDENRNATKPAVVGFSPLAPEIRSASCPPGRAFRPPAGSTPALDRHRRGSASKPCPSRHRRWHRAHRSCRNERARSRGRCRSRHIRRRRASRRPAARPTSPWRSRSRRESPPSPCR
jgi:ABC-type branched-subunit amino acid transport system substrate-binding protein